MSDIIGGAVLVGLLALAVFCGLGLIKDVRKIKESKKAKTSEDLKGGEQN